MMAEINTFEVACQGYRDASELEPLFPDADYHYALGWCFYHGCKSPFPKHASDNVEDCDRLEEWRTLAKIPADELTDEQHDRLLEIDRQAFNEKYSSVKETSE
jgi:hypothetical protein